MVVAVIDGVVQFAPEAVTPVLGVPVVKTEPPVEAEYQSISLPARVAEIATVPLPQREPLPAVGADGLAITVATTAVREVETQPVLVLRDSA